MTNGTAQTDKTAGRLVPKDAAKPKSASTVIRAYSVLAGALDGAVRDGRVSRNPARIMKDGLPRKKKRRALRRYLTHEQVDAVAAQRVPR